MDVVGSFIVIIETQFWCSIQFPKFCLFWRSFEVVENPFVAQYVYRPWTSLAFDPNIKYWFHCKMASIAWNNFFVIHSQCINYLFVLQEKFLVSMYQRIWMFWIDLVSVALLQCLGEIWDQFWKASIMTLHCDTVLVAVHLGHCCTGSRHIAVAKRTLLGQVTSIGFLQWQLFPTLIPLRANHCLCACVHVCQSLPRVEGLEKLLEIKSSKASLAQWSPFYPDLSVVLCLMFNSRFNKSRACRLTDLLAD